MMTRAKDKEMLFFQANENYIALVKFINSMSDDEKNTVFQFEKKQVELRLIGVETKMFGPSSFIFLNGTNCLYLGLWKILMAIKDPSFLHPIIGHVR